MADTTAGIGSAPAAEGPPGGLIVGFWGRRWPLFRILLKNTFLGIVTLGFYRFWGRTRLRRFFWGCVAIDGEPLEYTGRGLELFVGFLLVIAVMIPVTGGYSFLALFLQTVAPDYLGPLELVYFLGIAWLIQYGQFRARRYRLSRTVWRGIRAGQDGVAGRYAWRWTKYALFSIVTLGWAVPWMTVALQRYQMENARFGAENFRYDGNGRDLLRRWAPCPALWMAGLLAALGIWLFNWSVLGDAMQNATFTDDGELVMAEAAQELLLWSFGIIGVAYILSIPFYIAYRIAVLRYLFQASSLADIRFKAGFSGWRLVGYWAVSVAVVLTVMAVVVAIAASLFGHAFAADNSGDPDGDMLAGLGALVAFVVLLLWVLLAPVMSYLLFTFPALRHIATTLQTTDISSLDRIIQSTRDSPRFGEGIADAFDVDVGGM